MAGLAYVGENGNRHLIHFLADGDRPVLEIYVDMKPGTEELPISINGVGQPLDNIQLTKGLTAPMIVTPEDSAGIPTGVMVVPNLELIALYVLPRIHTLMARVYVPTKEG